jgi:methionyl-tRNA formyltransferase
MKQLNIVFAGTPEFGIPCLNALVKSQHKVIAVYTQPDRPAGRGRKLQPSAVKAWALEQAIPIYQPQNFKTEEAVWELAKLKPDIMVVIAYGLILPLSVLSIPKLGCVNVHASLLPKYRGASPIQEAILQGDSVTGVTIMQMDKGMDTGPIYTQSICPIESEDTAASLHLSLSELAIQPLLNTLNLLAEGKANAIPQDPIGISYAGKINKENAEISWGLPALQIHNLIRAFNPWPIAYTHKNQELLRIHEASVEDCISSEKPGTIIAIEKKGMLITTGEQGLRVKKLQFAGGKVLSVAEWMNSGLWQSFLHQILQ